MKRFELTRPRSPPHTLHVFLFFFYFNAEPLAVHVYRLDSWRVRDWDLTWKDGENTKCLGVKKESGSLFIMFPWLNVMFDSLVLSKYHIKEAWSHSWAHSGGEALGDFVLSRRWADYQLWNNGSLVLPSAQTSGHACAPASRGLPVSKLLTGCYDFICHPLRRTVSAATTVFGCLLSPCFFFLALHGSDAADKTLHLCLSHTAAAPAAVGTPPKSFIYEHCDIERSAGILNLQTSQFAFFFI